MGRRGGRLGGSCNCRDGVEGGKWEGGDDDGDDRNDKRGWNDETAAAAGYPHLDIILFKR